MAFDDVVRLLDETKVVAIVTTRKNGERAATAIWSMVVDGVPYVRSAYGDVSWWYKHVVGGRPGVVHRRDDQRRGERLHLPGGSGRLSLQECRARLQDPGPGAVRGIRTGVSAREPSRRRPRGTPRASGRPRPRR